MFCEINHEVRLGHGVSEEIDEFYYMLWSFQSGGEKGEDN